MLIEGKIASPIYYIFLFMFKVIETFDGIEGVRISSTLDGWNCL